MNRRKFIGACACCTFACAQAQLFNKDNLNSDLSNPEYMVRYIEIHLAEHCNLNCKCCLHFSPIAQKEFYDLDKFKQDMAQMSSLFNKRLYELQLFGGEPLLNPQINEYVKTSRKYFPKTTITIVTNGTLLDDMNKSFWKTLNKNEVSIVPSIYPVKINWASVLDKAKKYNVGIYGDYKHKNKLTLDNIEKFQKNSFYKIILNEKGYDYKNNKKRICDGIDKSVLKKFRYGNMYDGKLYPCFSIAYVRHLNKKFNTDFIVSEGDYLDLYKVKDIKEVRRFLERPDLYPFCRYCKFDSKQVKWENSKEHTLSEWT